MKQERELVFLHGQRTIDCRAVVDKHYIGYHTLQYCASGAVELFYNRQRHEIKPGMFWAAYPGPHIRFHSASSGTGWDHRYIAFTGPLVRHWETTGLIPRSPARPMADCDWGREMDQLVEEATEHDRFSQLRAINRLETILSHLIEAEQDPESDDAWIQATLNALQAAGHFPNYRRVANKVRVSERTLRRRFRASLGISLHEYTIQHRLAAACQLLRRTDLSIAEVAEQLGYRDVFFFSRQFRERMKLSPSTFRATRL